LALSAVLAATACVAPAISPSVDRVAAIRNLVVVAVESPPLVVTDSKASDFVARSAGASIIRGAMPVPGVEVLVLLGGVIMLIEWAASPPKAPATASLSDLLTKGLVWSPTRELAEEATAHLRSTSGSRVVSTSTKYRELRVEKRGATWHMENWYRPIRAWYSDETVGVDYRSDLGTNAVVLEIGLLNYEWHTDRLVVQVMMRLVDVKTGRVIGRTRHWAYPSVGRAIELLANDNARLKTVFGETARPLVAAGLKDLGLTN